MLEMQDQRVAGRRLLNWGLLLALGAHAVRLAEGQRQQVHPSVECSCTSADGAPDLGCRLASSFDMRPTRGGEKSQNKIFSCNEAPGQGGGGGGGGGGQWVTLSTGTYRLHRDALNWDEARRTCESSNAQLVALTDGKEESDLLLKAFPNAAPSGSANREDHFWLGIRYFADENNGNKPDYYTVRGQVATGLHWAKGEPNERGKNDFCVSLSKNVGLYDSPCTWKFMFFCRRV